MRIDFRTRTGKRIGSVTLLQFVTSWAALLTLLMFLATPEETLLAWADMLFHHLTIEHPDHEALIRPWYVTANTAFLGKWPILIKFMVAAIAFWLAGTRLLKGTSLLCYWALHQTLFLRTKLVTYKIKEEVRTYPNKSYDDYWAAIRDAKVDAKTLEKASIDQVITNVTTQSLAWACDSRQEAFSNIPACDRRRLKLLQECKRKLAEAAAKLNEQKIKFYVSPVQPSILYVVERLIRECNLGRSVAMVSSSGTGPQTVYYATKRVFNRSERDKKSQLSLFAAPLSAYVMFDPSSPETFPENPPEPAPEACPENSQTSIMLSQLFEAICVLLTEPQDILVVDDGNRTPMRKGKIVYYNNSTAEECWAKSSANTRSMFSKRVVDKYGEYLAYLRGEAPQNEGPLKPGDAIITWPPLTRFYEGRSVGDAHFNRTKAFEEQTQSCSRILLFAEKKHRDSDSALHEVADLLIEAILRTLHDLHITYSDRRPGLHLISHWKFTYSYRRLFRDLLGAS